ncbi:MAG: YggS family pyridoxal phosphate-dependent enzyme [Planctomycetes bacterium]|nr:YggS family pyridoxal phosphate-dependent enzyme [Planctomycetota bacterium]
MERPTLQATISDNLARVRGTIDAACASARRVPANVRLVAVTKSATLEAIRTLTELGVRDLGENRVQQLLQRTAEFGASLESLDTKASGGPPCWHMIGHLQRNKAKSVLGASRIIHSVDSRRLAEEILRQAEAGDADVDVLVEVNVSGEASKEGIAPPELGALVEFLQTARRLRLRGLMTMAPLELDPQQARPHFAALRELLESLRNSGAVPPECRELSMGMSNDYAVAIEEGATIVRVGSALFENT